jgi:hypothetical protein
MQGGHYNEQTKTLTWHHPLSTNEKISFSWSTNGSPGACGLRTSDPNAICIVTQWRGYTTSTGQICLDCVNLGLTRILLCDRTLGTCPDQ